MATALPWLIVGTVPIENLPVVQGTFSRTADTIFCPDAPPIPLVRGTATLVATVLCTLERLACPPPYVVLVGDTGNGQGSKALYQTLVTKTLPTKAVQGITFHYCYPDVDWHNRILLSIQDLPVRPMLVADAGFMYAAKMSGYAASYDLFTPDRGELAFLADPLAPHPFYTRGFLLADTEETDALVSRAYAEKNAADWLIVKGKQDCVVHQGKILATISDPETPAMEAIGGTGDLVTGVVSGLLASGQSLHDACVLACTVCRLVGKFANPTPATQIAALLDFLPAALDEALQK